MSKRVRPVTPLNLPRLKFSGSARRVGDFQRVQGGGRIDLPAMRLLGNANKRAQTGNIFANGTATLPKLKMGSGAALAIRRSKGQGISQMPLRGVALIGSVLRIDSEAATVQLFNASGNPSGAGPSSDPEGVFYGDTSLVAGDVWWVDQVPANCTVTAFPGGAFTVVATAAVATGPYQFRVNLRRGINGVRSAFMKDFVVSTSQIFVDTANPSAGTGTRANPYKTIQAAENAAASGAAILVTPGTYLEQVTVDTSNLYFLGVGATAYTPTVTIDAAQTRGNCFLTNQANILIDGFKVTQSRSEAIYIRGPNVTYAEVRNCWTYDTGSSGIGLWGTIWGNDPVTNGNYRGIQVARIHHNKIERACNTAWPVSPAGGFNEHITCANGVYDLKIWANDVGISSIVGPGYANASGGEGVDIKEGCELFEVYNNRFYNLSKNPIYLDAGRCNNGHTRPGFLKSGHVYNNLVYNNSGHGISVTAEIQTDSAIGLDGRKGGYVDGVAVDYNTVFGQVAAGFLGYDRGVAAGTGGWTTANLPIYNNVQVCNNIFHGNATGGTYTGVWWDHNWATNSAIKNNVTTGTTNGVRIADGAPTVSGNIASDPLFTNQGAADFTLTATSPARNVTNAAAVIPPFDFAGNPRPFGAAPDCGAYERQS